VGAINETIEALLAAHLDPDWRRRVFLRWENPVREVPQSSTTS